MREFKQGPGVFRWRSETHSSLIRVGSVQDLSRDRLEWKSSALDASVSHGGMIPRFTTRTTPYGGLMFVHSSLGPEF